MKNADFLKEIWINLPEEKKLTQDDVKLVIQSVFEVIADQISHGETIRIRNFGTFKCKILAAREMKLPKTGEIKQLPERKKVSFVASTKLKESLS